MEEVRFDSSLRRIFGVICALALAGSACQGGGSSSDPDGDGIANEHEGTGDIDGDGLQNAEDPDSDGDGYGDAEEAGDSDADTPPVDSDGDGFADFVDGDSDGDGAFDEQELLGVDGIPDTGDEGDRLVEDTDGDGFTDGGELASGSSPADATSVPQGIYAVLREGETISARIEMSTSIPKADVAFLMDTTGSMGEEIVSIREYFVEISETIGALVPDAAFAVAQYKDYAITPYGGMDDFPFRIDQQVTTDRPRVVAAMESLVASGGGDGPESQFEGLYQLASGFGFDLNGDGAFQTGDTRPFVTHPGDAFDGHVTGSFDPDSPDAATAGGIGFREGAFRLVVHATDAHHRDPDTGWALGNPGTRPSGKSDAVEALQAIGAHVIGVASGASGFTAMSEVAAATGALADLDGDGAVDDPLVYRVEWDGGGLPEAVTDAIVKMLTESQFDTTLAVKGDKWEFLKSSFPDGVASVRPGETVIFDVELIGTITSGREDRVYFFELQLVSEDGTILDTNPVVVVVPRA